MSGYVVEVNEGATEATRQGIDWWELYRKRYEGTGRITETTPGCIVGGQVPALDGDQHVHLWVFTPGTSGGFVEFNVPVGEPDETGAIPPGTWCWPPRV